MGGVTPLQAAMMRGHQHVVDELERPMKLYESEDEDEAELARALRLSVADCDGDTTVNLSHIDDASAAPLLGKRVVACGLSRDDVNGLCGTALSFEPATGRYAVYLGKGNKASKYSLKPTNLMRDLTSQRVVTHGLSREDMNGRHGTALSFDSSTGRYAVRLEPDRKVFKLKPANLRMDATTLLQRATKSYPFEALRDAIDEAADPEVEVDPQALVDAQARLVVLATEKLVGVMHRRKLEPLVVAVAKAEKEGLTDAAALTAAHALVAELEAEPPRAAPAPAGTHALNELTRPTHIDPAVFEPFMHCAGQEVTAEHDYKYWGGDVQPWRNGVDDTPVMDPDVIALEEKHKLAAETEDDPETAGTEGHTTKKRPQHALKLRCCGVRSDYLLGLTFALNMWDWPTWKVATTNTTIAKTLSPTLTLCNILLAVYSTVPYPTLTPGGAVPGEAHDGEGGPVPLRRAGSGAAIHRRRHNLHEPLLGRAVGRPGRSGVRGRGHEPDRVVSWAHVAASCTQLLAYHWSSRCNIRHLSRIDVFAVRQFPGNGADLDFREVLPGCTAAIVAAAPVEGTLLNDNRGDDSVFTPTVKQAFLKSDEYAAVAKVLPFVRLW